MHTVGGNFPLQLLCDRFLLSQFCQLDGTLNRRLPPRFRLPLAIRNSESTMQWNCLQLCAFITYSSCRSSPPYAAVLVAPRVMLSLLRRRLPPRPAAVVLSGLLPFLPVRSSAPPLSLFLSLSLSLSSLYRRLVAVTSSPKAETIQLDFTDVTQVVSGPTQLPFCCIAHS